MDNKEKDGFYIKNSGFGSKKVGPQGNGGGLGGQEIKGVNNPNGLTPKKIGEKPANLNPQGPTGGVVGK